MKLQEFSLKEPVWVAVAALMATVLGVVCVLKLPKDILPIFKTPAVQIVTFYPGMPAEVVEKDMTTRLERWTGQSNGIAMQQSKSMIGVSIVKDFFRPDIDPNTAMSQVTSFAMSDLYYLPPGTVPPMVMPFDPTASIPLALLTVENPAMNETQLYDVAYFNLRNMLQGITGVIAPAVYGGTLRRILAYVDPYKMSKLNLSGLDVANALALSNVMIPAGNAKLGDKDYQIVTNGMAEKVDMMNRFLIRGEYGVPITVGDVAKVQDSHQIQTNVVRIGGKRQVYIPIYRQPGANTIQIVDDMKAAVQSLLERLPKGMILKIVADQSQFVREAIKSISVEVGMGGILSALVVLIFLGSLRSSLAVFLAIPLSLLACFIGLYAAKQTINAMTLGGLALAVGRLIDDSIVVLENTVRHLKMGKPPRQAALEAAGEVSMPVLAATVTTVIVFVPVIFLTGIAKFLFTPLAMSVAFSIAASYVVSMTVIPSFCARFLKGGPSFVSRERETKSLYEKFLSGLMRIKIFVIAAVIVLFAYSLSLYPKIGKELFPRADVGHLTLTLRLPTGTRIEKTEEVMARVEQALRKKLGEATIETLITNIGVLYDWPAAYTPNSGPGDAFMELELSKKRSLSAEEYAQQIRAMFREEFPGVDLAISTGGLITAALNMGAPSPIHIQVSGKDLQVSHTIAEDIVGRIKDVPGTRDVRIQERLDYPQIEIALDRDAIAAKRLSVDDVVKNIATALNSSITFRPAFWIDPKNGNHYFLGAQYPEESVQDIGTLKDLPLTGKGQMQVVRLQEVAKFKESVAPSELRHHNIQRVMDIYVNTSGRDIGAVAADIGRKIKDVQVPEGYAIYQRGEVQSMRESFKNLMGGLLLAVLLVYLVLAGQFRSFRDPLLILFTVPMGLIGVLGTLWYTNTTLNVQSLIGIIFMVGVAVSNGILMIEFANRLKAQGMTPEEAAAKAASVRLRPIVMTSLAAMLGLLPMAIGFGHGSEANVPLGRAVLGGLAASTLLTLIVLPILYAAVESFGKGVKVLGVVLVCVLLTGNALADEVPDFQGSKVMTLKEATDTALRNNPGITAAQADHELAQSDVAITSAALWPRVNLSGMNSFGLGGSSQATGIAGVVNSPFRRGWGGGFDASWVVYDFGQRGLAVDSLKSEGQAREEEIAQRKAEIKIAVIQTYLACAMYWELNVLLQEREKRQKLLSEEIEKYVQSGLTSPVELDLSKASWEKTHASRIEIGGWMLQSTEKLKELMGDTHRENFVCRMPTQEFPAVPALRVMVMHALKNRPEIRAARSRYEAARFERLAIQGERLPKIVAVSSAGLLASTRPAGGKDWSAGVGVTVPIFDGFLIAGKVRKAMAQEKKARANLREWQNRIKQEVLGAHALWEAVQASRQSTQRELQFTLKAYDLAHKRYQDKMGTFQELRDAESAYDQSAQKRWNTEMNYQLSYRQLVILFRGKLG